MAKETDILLNRLKGAIEDQKRVIETDTVMVQHVHHQGVLWGLKRALAIFREQMEVWDRLYTKRNEELDNKEKDLLVREAELKKTLEEIRAGSYMF